jgi:hypothetical protein
MKNFLLKILNKFKTLITIFIVLSTCILTVHFDFFQVKTKIYEKYPNLFLRHFLFEGSSVKNKVLNDYNIRFLPYTQFFKSSLIKKKLIFDNSYYNPQSKNGKSTGYSSWGTFYLENYNNKLVVTDYNGSIYYHDELNEVINSSKKELKLNDLNPIRVFDTFFHKNNFYISYTTEKNGCKRINISVADFNLNFLKFKDFFNPVECNDTGQIGRMQFFIHQEKPGILVTTMEGIHDEPGINSQNDESIFGKIIFINLKNLKYYNFSKGHRVAQGLYANKDLIIASEHGPRGGDEINKIIYKKNYGWPVASYGERYDFNYEKKPHYKKSHASFGFEEPIYAFSHGLGISEILMLKDNFSNFFKKDVLTISTLGAKSIFFASFDDGFNRILSMEKIFLNERVRDLKYHKKSNSLLLAFEENGELGILSSEN